MTSIATLEPLQWQTRNAQPTTHKVKKLDVVIAKHSDTITRWLRLKSFYISRRGATLGANQKPIPRTTNSDVLQIATHWSRELKKVSPQDAHDRRDHARWKQCVDTVSKLADPNKPDAEYAKNEVFWQVCTRRLSVYLDARKSVPSRWQIFKESVVETIAGVPGVLGDATKTTAGLVSGAAGGVAKVFADPAKAALFVVGTAILLPPIVRAVRK